MTPYRQVAIYFSWSRPEETGAPLSVIEDRFPTLFESRRMFYPRLSEFSDPTAFDQGIAGLLDHIQKPNFAAFAELARNETGRPARIAERVDDQGARTPLDDNFLRGVDTLIVIGYDSLRTRQAADEEEIRALRAFLDDPGNLAFICPHHDIGDYPDQGDAVLARLQLADFSHHGDRAIPPRQGFGGFCRSLFAGLGTPVENRFGLRPALEADGSPAAIEVAGGVDRLGLLDGVKALNLHPHLPHFERLAGADAVIDVLARQKIDLSAPPHPFCTDGRSTFDAIVQSRPETFRGTLLAGDATLWSSTAGGVENLRRLWINALHRPVAHGNSRHGRAD